MPIIEVIYGPQVSRDGLQQLAGVLPHAVSVAVECPEEPYDHHLQPGDVDIRFRARGPYDVGGLDVMIEVRSKYFESRSMNRQQRCDQLLDLVAPVVPRISIGIYLSLPAAAWAQRG